MKSKYISLLLALVFALSLLGGCGSPSTSTSEDSSAEESTSVSDSAETSTESESSRDAAEAESGTDAVDASDSATAEADESAPASDESVEDAGQTQWVEYALPITTDSANYTFMVGLNPGVSSFIEDYSENQVISEWMERTGIHVAFNSVHPSAASENFNLALAAGDMPDITDNGLDYYNGSTSSSIVDEIFANILDYADYCPNYMTAIESNEMIKKALTTDDGYVAAFYMLRTSNTSGEGMLIRQDWLDQLGMDVPTTYDEVYEVLIAFKNELGATSPMLLNNSGTWSMGAFGWGYDMNGYMTTDPTVSLPLYVVDGEVRFAMLEDEYEDYLNMISQWYQEGLIVQDIENISMFQTCTDYIINDETGYFYSASSMLSTYSEQAVSADFSLTAAPQPKLSEDAELHFSQAYDFDYDGEQALAALNNWTISATAPDMETLIQCIDYFYSPEGTILANYGVENVSFTYDEDGVPHFSELITNNTQGMTMDNAVYIYTLQYGAFVEDYNRYNDTYTEAELNCAETWSIDIEDNYSYPVDFVSLTTEESERYSALFSDISTYLQENILKFITGAKSLDEYAAFKEDLISMGLDEVVQIYQDAYDRFLER